MVLSEMSTDRCVADPIKITLYRWAGKKWGLCIESECAECDLAVAQVRAVASAHPDWLTELEVKPWLTYLWESLRHGGWHAPVVLVDGRLVCQGIVPSRETLEAALQFALARRVLLVQGQKQNLGAKHTRPRAT